MSNTTDKYIRKMNIVSAFKWCGEPDCPEWLDDAFMNWDSNLSTERQTPGAAKVFDGWMTVIGANSTYAADLGEYILKDGRGFLSVLSAKEFENSFSSVASDTQPIADEYQECTLKTENLDFENCMLRLKTPVISNKLMVLMGQIFDLTKELDKIKKHVFYGKEVEFKDQALYMIGTPISDIDKDQLRRLHCVLGMLTESGELAELCEQETFNGATIDITTWLKEWGDPLWYVAVAADTHKTKLSKVLGMNIAKLRKRYTRVDGNGVSTFAFTEKAAQEHKGD